MSCPRPVAVARVSIHLADKQQQQQQQYQTGLGRRLIARPGSRRFLKLLEPVKAERKLE